MIVGIVPICFPTARDFIFSATNVNCLRIFPTRRKEAPRFYHRFGNDDRFYSRAAGNANVSISSTEEGITKVIRAVLPKKALSPSLFKFEFSENSTVFSKSQSLNVKSLISVTPSGIEIAVRELQSKKALSPISVHCVRNRIFRILFPLGIIDEFRSVLIEQNAVGRFIKAVRFRCKNFRKRETAGKFCFFRFGRKFCFRNFISREKCFRNGEIFCVTERLIISGQNDVFRFA